MKQATITIGGEAGFGIMTTGLLLGKIGIRSGYYVYEYDEYPSLIRGGHNVASIRISDHQLHAQEKQVDILVCLNKETFDKHQSLVKKGGIVIYDEADINPQIIKNKKYNLLNIPFKTIIKEQALPSLMINNIALGALMSLLGMGINILNGLITDNFKRKGQEVVNSNIKAAKTGFDIAAKNNPAGFKIKFPKKEQVTEQIYISGNEMIGIGAVMADCRFYAAYPMTPASNLLHYLASQASRTGMVVKHAEDEISVINMALGASFAGVRSMVGTSGGGYALMVEAVSLAGITEIPLVVMMGQRPGPATSMPTWTEQGDLLFVTFSGHGEFPKIVLAPGDMEEAYSLTLEAFNLADKYQTPVFILTDKYLLEGHQSVETAKILSAKQEIDRGSILSAQDILKLPQFKRYEATANGVSPRVILGTKNSVHQVNSYEHLEDGHTTEEESERQKQVDKRNRKIQTYIKKGFNLPVLFGLPDRELTVVSWGSVKGPVMEAMEINPGFNYLHFNHLWPLDHEKIKDLLGKCKNLLLIENNSQGQFGQLLQMGSGVEIKNKLLKYSGRPFYPEEILIEVTKYI